jgi:hypothetical protein
LPIVCPFTPALFPVAPLAVPLLLLLVLLLLLLLFSIIDAGGRGRWSGVEEGDGDEEEEGG